MTITELEQAITDLSDHYMDGYDCEWGCQDRYDSPQFPRTQPDCDMNEPEHNDELISRRRVLELISQVAR